MPCHCRALHLIWLLPALLAAGATAALAQPRSATAAIRAPAASAPAQATSAEDTARALHLLARATFGVRPADLEQVLKLGTGAWLDAQLAAPAATEAAMKQALAAGPSSQRRQLAMLATARLERAVSSERQLEEVMTQFWFNHFNVYFGKGVVRQLVADYEQRAIRAHVFGRFRDLLLATAQHPAMLFYLDNWLSVSIDTLRLRGARVRAAASRRGLNENYARELLELHTLGVDGGYTQEDVQAVARAFTGWTFNLPPRDSMVAASDVRFVFRPLLHDRGVKRVLGHELPAGRGEEDGREVIELLASHPATARFVAHKLVERFVNDAGDAALEAELAEVFTRTDGDLRAVTRALFESPHFHAPEHRAAKLKTPFELVASALRVTSAVPVPSRALMAALQSMGELPYSAAEPTGFPAVSEEWTSSGALLARLNFALDLAAGRIDGIRPQLPLHDRSPAALAQSVLPGRDTRALEAAIAAELAQHADEMPRAREQRALGLLLGSPDFQRR